MKQSLFVLVLFFFFQPTGDGQVLDELSQLVGNPAAGMQETVQKIIRTRDGGFVVSGQWHSGQAFLQKYNHCGDSLWLRLYDLGQQSAFNDLAETAAGHLLAVGFCEGCHLSADTKREGVVVLVNEQGVLQEERLLSELGYPGWISALTATEDGGWAITGSRELKLGLNYSQSFIARLDDALDVRWLRFYDFLWIDEGRDIIATYDGGFAVCGQSQQFGTPLIASFLKTDSLGNRQWQLKGDDYGFSANALAQLPSGALIATGAVAVDSIQRNDLYVLKLDESSGEVLDYHTYGNGSTSTLSGFQDEGRDLAVLPDGRITVGGAYGLAYNLSSAWLLMLDEGLGRIKEQRFPDPYGGAAYGVQHLILLDSMGDQFAFIADRRIFPNYRDGVFSLRAEPGRRLRFRAMPRHGQLYARNPSTNRAEVRIEGTTEETAHSYRDVRLRVYREGVLYADPEPFPLVYADGTAAFSFTFGLPAELANYRFEVWAGDGEREYLEACARDVVAGDAFLVQGQSNAVANFGEDAGENRHPFLRVYGSGGLDAKGWRLADPNGDRESYGNTGKWAARLGALLIQEYRLPVAILNGAHGGQESDFFLPDSANYRGLLDRVREAGLEKGIRAIFWYQGETDVFAHNRIDLYKQRFRAIYDAWRRDYAGFEKVYLMQIRSACFGLPPYRALPIMEAQRQLAQELPDVTLMSTTGLQHDGCHFPYEGGYKVLGEHLFRLLGRDLYGADTLQGVEPPQPERLVLSDSLELSLLLEPREDTFVWEDGAEADFTLEGSKERVVGGKIMGNTMVLRLSGCPEGMTGLSYAGHSYTDSPFVKNKEGVGLVNFFHFPLASPAGCRLVSMFHPAESANWRIYPQPADDEVQIAWEGEYVVGPGFLTLMTAAGRVIYHEPFPEAVAGRLAIPLSALPGGIYFLRINTGRGIRTERIVKK